VAAVTAVAVALAIALGFGLYLAWAIAIYAVSSFLYEVEQRRRLGARLEVDPRWARGWSLEIDPAYDIVAFSYFSTKEYAKARGLLEEGLARNLEGMRRSTALYNLACAEALLDDREAALEHVNEAVKEPYFRKRAAKDPDLDSIRDDSRFPVTASS
jgi:hypothetical protein